MRNSLVLLAALIFLSGCNSIGSVLEGLDRPHASVSGVRLADLDGESVTLVFDVDVQNPYGVALPVAGLDYRLLSGATPVVEGSGTSDVSIPANGTGTIPLSAKVPFAQAMSVLQGIRPGNVVPYDADLGISLRTPVTNDLRIPLQRSGEFPIPNLPDVNVSGFRWEKLDLFDAVAAMDVTVGNTNDFPLDLAQLDYTLSLFGKDVARSAIEKAAALSPGQQTTIPLRFNLQPSQLGTSIAGLLGGNTEYSLDGLTRFDSQFGPLNFPFKSGNN